MTRQSFLYFPKDQAPGLGPIHLGEREISLYSDLGAGAQLNNSFALWCPYCARLWGKAEVEGSNYCRCINTSCPEHMRYPSDGTFTRQFAEPKSPQSDTDLPYEVLRHDVAALCGYYLNHPQQLKLFRHLT